MVGGEHQNQGLIVWPERRDELLEACVDLPGITLTPRQLADLELLLNGGFAPLTGFMTGVEYIHVCCEMRLPDDRLWPLPVTLRVDEAVATHLETPMLALRDRSGVPLAVLNVEDVWQPDLLAEAAAVFGTVRDEHLGVATLAREPGTWYVGGRIEGLQLPEHHDFRDLRKTPAQLQELFRSHGWQRVVALQANKPLSLAQVEFARDTAEQLNAGVLVHASVGPTTDTDLDPLTRVRCHRSAFAHLPPDTFELAVLPLAMRMAGPREALGHALIARNFGCTHVIVGHDHAGPGVDSDGDPFYQPTAAQQLVRTHAADIGIEVVSVGTTPDEATVQFPEVERILRERRRPKGCAVFFVGLPGAGSSTVAGVLAATLGERGIEVTLLDGDDVHQPGFVAAEVARHGGLVLCAAPPPKGARRLVEDHGRFLLVHVNTPRFVCEARDPKGLYRRARAGHADLPGEPAPTNADIVVDTMVRSPEESAELVLEHLLELGVVPTEDRADVVIPATRSRSEPVDGRATRRRSVSVLPKTGQ